MSGIYVSILPSAIQKDSLSRSCLAVGNDGISHRADARFEYASGEGNKSRYGIPVKEILRKEPTFELHSF
jgi:hypothetical protein